MLVVKYNISGDDTEKWFHPGFWSCTTGVDVINCCHYEIWWYILFENILLKLSKVPNVLSVDLLNLCVISFNLTCIGIFHNLNMYLSYIYFLNHGFLILKLFVSVNKKINNYKHWKAAENRHFCQNINSGIYLIWSTLYMFVL